MKGKRFVTREFIAEGMTCTSCERIIRSQAMKIEGVIDCKADYATQKARVKYDAAKTSLNRIFSKIAEKGYSCSELKQDKGSRNVIAWVFGVIGIIIALYFVIKLSELISLPDITQNLSYGLLFLVGIVTGFHCISMCGGFVVSYTAKHAQEGRPSHISHLLYGGGKTVSYTIIGALFGLIGSVIAFTPAMRGIIGIIAGIFLMIYGVNMLNILPFLRKFQLRTPEFIARFVGHKSSKSGPLVTGLLNGLMLACGPLQAMYILAAGTGSMVEGAKMLFIFGLGTLPVMLGFGYLTSFISSKMTHKILKVSGIIVIVLGIIMLNRGLALTGSGYDAKSIIPLSGKSAGNPSASAGSDPAYQEIRMDVTRYGWSPDTFVLKKGVPVRWVINGKELTSCNKAIQVPKLGLSFDIKAGEQVIEFTPTEQGTIPFSCWMGMIQGTFIVKDSANINNNEQIQQEIVQAKTQQQTGVCSMGGGCGCGMM